METSEHDPISRFRGAVLGAAVAEALAFPYKHYSRSFLRSMVTPLIQEFATHHSGFYPRGQYGDETQVMLVVMKSLMEAGGLDGETLVSHMIPLWRENLLVEQEASTAEAMRRIVQGKVDWREAGLDSGRAEAAPVARVVSLALWDLDDSDRLREDVAVCTRITHRDPRVLACATAAAMAIQSNLSTEELRLGVFLDRVAGGAARFDSTLAEAILDFPRILSMSEGRVYRHVACLSPDDQYPPSDDGLSEYCMPAVLTALYYFLKSPYRYEKTVESCIRCGGSMDVAAFLAGAMSGALNGETGLPSNLTEDLLNVTEIAALTESLHARRAGRAGRNDSEEPGPSPGVKR